MDQRDATFPAFVAEHEQQLLGTALLLTGDPAAADELVVAALARTHRRWRRLDSPAAALAEARAALVGTSTGRPPEPGGARDDQPADADRRWLQELAALDPLVRAVAVLRLHDEQDEESTAALLRCTPAEVAAALASALRVLEPLVDSEAEEPAAEVSPDGPVRRPDDPGTPLDDDPHAAYRRPRTPPGAPLRSPPSTPPHPAAVPASAGDPDAIYRRPS